MESGTPNPSTLQAFTLGPSRSVADGALPVTVTECVLLRIPMALQVQMQGSVEASANGTSLPPTSNSSSPQHFAFIRSVQVQPLPNSPFLLEVYPVVSFTRTEGAVATYNTLAPNIRALLLPLPPLSANLPTPVLFGQPLDLGGWSFSRPSFLLVNPQKFIMPSHRPFKRMVPPHVIPFSELSRIEQYLRHLRSIQTNNTTSNSHPPLNDGPDRVGSNLQRGQTGDGGGQVDSAASLANSSPTRIDPAGGQEKAEAELDLSFKTQGLLVASEGVDADAEDADATFLDDLLLLASIDPTMWMGELNKYLQEEKKEKELLQKEQAARLAHWREDVGQHTM
ncbi:hypothetical protein H0H92_015362 [Tricholoma furcatifolium]|nr:hypothetical protein H0H92_015362 [Tricholoma furcatifolium]